MLIKVKMLGAVTATDDGHNEFVYKMVESKLASTGRWKMSVELRILASRIGIGPSYQMFRNSAQAMITICFVCTFLCS
jgi:hypothetical protein